MIDWIPSSPQIFQIQWKKLVQRVQPDRQNEQLQASVVLQGSDDVDCIFYDNICLKQGVEYVTPIGQLTHYWLDANNLILEPIIFASPMKISVLGVYFTTDEIFTGPLENPVQLQVQRVSNGEILCRRTLDDNVTTTPGTLAPFSEVNTEFSIFENDSLRLVPVGGDAATLPPLIIVTVWEVKR